MCKQGNLKFTFSKWLQRSTNCRSAKLSARFSYKIQHWANKRKLAKSWSYYGYGIKPGKDRVESWERRCDDSTCSFWLACLFLSNPTCFSQNISEFPSNLSFRMKEWLDCCMDVCSSSKYGSDIGLKRLSYRSKIIFYQHQNITISIKGDRHNHSLSKVYRFNWSCRVFFY